MRLFCASNSMDTVLTPSALARLLYVRRVRRLDHPGTAAGVIGFIGKQERLVRPTAAEGVSRSVLSMDPAEWCLVRGPSVET
jgi:hypothetical protein